MSQENEAEEEPSIEEILASIRQIISDDDEEETAAEEQEEEVAAAEPEAEPEPVEPEPEVEAEPEPVEEIAKPEPAVEPEPAPEPEEVVETVEAPEEEEEILELTEKVEDEDEFMEVDIDADNASDDEELLDKAADQDDVVAAEEPVAAPMIDAPQTQDEGDKLFSEKVEEAALGAFASLATKPAAKIDRSGSVTIEDVIREEMRPMLKAWLDQNLPELIERLVQEELERVARRASKY